LYWLQLIHIKNLIFMVKKWSKVPHSLDSFEMIERTKKK